MTFEHFDISLHATPMVCEEAFTQLLDRVDLQQTRSFEVYQLCNVDEYFDLQFSTQSTEIPVIVDEKLFISLSCLSLEEVIHTEGKFSYSNYYQ